MSDIVKNEFKNPSAIYRTAPFWSWNGVMDDDEIAFQLRDFKEHGIGGAFAHARAGMITEYLSDDFFRAWKGALETVREENMKLYMYDENAWPSGMAGGKVAASNRETLGAIAKLRIVEPSQPSMAGELLFAAEYFEDDVMGKILTDIPRAEWKNHTSEKVMMIYVVEPSGGGFGGGHPYPDITNRLTTDTFLKITYDEYFKRFGDDFGTLVPAVFSDEANIHTEGSNTLCFTPVFEKRFRELCGYDLRPNVAAAFRNVKGIKLDRPAEKVRYDYYHTAHDLWIENFVRPIADWCGKHNIAWTGHDIEHQWPQSHGGRMNPSEQSTYEFRQWPGLDLLLCDHLRDTTYNFDRYLMFEIRSAANQFGKERTLSEAYGAGGYHSTMYDYKRLGDYLMVGGINFIVQHLTLFSYIGARKRDCPQSFDYRQPWWEEYTEMAEYFARTSYITSQGKMEQRILLLNTSTSTYVVPGEEQLGTIDHGLDVKCIRNPDMSDYLTVVNKLTDEGWDFDIGDEFSIERNAKIEDGLFKLGLQSYSTVVISKNMTNLRSQTVKLLAEYAAAGGRIITTDGEKAEFGRYIDGETDRPETEQIRSIVITIDGADAICDYLDTVYERRITSSAGWPVGVQSMRRVLDDGRVCWFVVNHSMGTFESDITVDGDCAAKWDLYTGDAAGIDCVKADGKVTFPVCLERCGTVLVVTGEELPAAKDVPAATEAVALETVSILPETTNTFTIDHIETEYDGKSNPPRYFLEATDKLFKARDIHGDPWSGTQIGTVWVDMNETFGEGTGFKATYRFEIAPGVLPCDIKLVVEQPTLWTVAVNDTVVESIGRDSLDRDMGLYDVGGILREGGNTVTITRDRFNIHCELESIFLRGNFSVDTTEDGSRFIVTPARQLGYGCWAEQGMPFYPYGVNYTYKANLDSAPESAIITVDEMHEAAVISATVNGEYVGFVGREGGSSLQIGSYLKAGENEIVLRVSGSLRNLLGPHLEYKEPIPYDWSFFIRDRAASADEYQFSRYGLDRAPTLKISK